MRIFALVTAALVAAGAAGCSSDDKTASHSPTPLTTSASPGTTGSSAPEIHMRAGNTFSPSQLTVPVGTAVKVVDDDGDAPHNFVVDGVGRSETMQEGDQFSLTFAKAGTFQFVCTFHEDQGMKGSVTVS
jgi:plastocyanin